MQTIFTAIATTVFFKMLFSVFVFIKAENCVRSFDFAFTYDAKTI
jgi:hypothetical protein